MREYIGIPSFYLENGSIDYGSVLEYSFACIFMLVVVASVFKLILNWIR